MEKERTSILLNKEDLLKLKSIAKKINKSASFLIQEAVTEYIARTVPKKKIDIIGIVDSGDPYFADKVEDTLNEITAGED